MIWDWTFLKIPKIVDLIKLVTESYDYGDDFVKDRVEIITIERNENFKKKRQKKQKENCDKKKQKENFNKKKQKVNFDKEKKENRN